LTNFFFCFFRQTSKFWSKVEILVTSRNFGQKSKINIFTERKTKFFLQKKSKFLQIENQHFLQNNQNFYPNKIIFLAFFDKKIKICIKIDFSAFGDFLFFRSSIAMDIPNLISEPKFLNKNVEQNYSDNLNSTYFQNQCCEFAKFSDAMPCRYRAHQKFWYRTVPRYTAVFRAKRHYFLKDKKRGQNFKKI